MPTVTKGSLTVEHTQHGAGFLARSERYPERVAALDDWLAERPEHSP